MSIRAILETPAETELHETKLVLLGWAKMQGIHIKESAHVADIARSLEKAYTTPRPKYVTGNIDHVSVEACVDKGYVYIHPKEKKPGCA